MRRYRRIPRSAATVRGDGLGERAATGIAGADEEHAHAQASPIRVGHALAQHARRDGAGPDHAGMPTHAVHHGGGSRRREAAAVEHAQLAERHGIRPLRQNLPCAHRRRNPRAVGAGGRDRVAVRLDEARRAGVARPADRHASLGSSQLRWHPLLAPGEHQRERPRPVAGYEVRGVARQMEIEPGRVFPFRPRGAGRACLWGAA